MPHDADDAASRLRKIVIGDADDDAGHDEQPYTDLGNARRLVEAHGADLRYAPQLGSWLAWDGARWAEDVTGEAHRRAKAVVDGMLTQIATVVGDAPRKRLTAHWLRSQGSARLAAMVELARTEPGLPVTVTELDADPWIWNTRAGAIDLRTGVVREAERRLLVTKISEVRPAATADCPRWLAFLDWAMQGDADMIAFLQRAVGYSLTGRIDEQCLFFLHGHGENGKSTFLNVLERLGGDYAISAEPDLLLATQQERHTTGIADLVGRRLVVVQETDEGRRLAEATVKKLTGGDTIRARRMRQDNFEFYPTHKLWMSANHRPQVRGTDHAIWRRIRLIPFNAQLAPGEADKTLLDKLLAELPGIAKWALDGCLQWQSMGLQPPSAVVVATASYRTEQDHVGRFIEDVCELGDDLCVSARDLRAAYERWCEENGERPWSAKAMGPQLTERGCERLQDGHSKAWTWVGITLAGRPEKCGPSLAAQRMGRAYATAGTPAAHAAHSERAAGAESQPATTETAAHRGPSTCSPYAHARDPYEPGNGPQGPRTPAEAAATDPDLNQF